VKASVEKVIDLLVRSPGTMTTSTI